jgi:hypothetical protein
MEYFVLHSGSGGGGGGSVVFNAKFSSACLRGANDDSRSDWTDGIAARLCAHVARLGKSFHQMFNLRRRFLFSGLSLLAPRYRRTGNDDCPSRNDRLLAEIAAACRSSFGSTNTFELPVWSMLHETTLVAEQLENTFARSIFLGEALCKISNLFDIHGYQSRYFKILLGNDNMSSAKKPNNIALCEESRTILSAINLGDLDHNATHFRHYITASLLERDVLGDVRRLRLVHNEMIYRLAMALGRSQSSRRHSDEFRFARLAEFAHLSSGFFGIDDCGVVEPDIVDEFECDPLRASPIARQVVRDLSDYGKTTMVIINTMPIDRGSKGDHASEPFVRLSQLVGDILSCDGKSTSES